MFSHGIMFHHFHDDKGHIKSQGSIAYKELENIIKYCIRRGYRLLKADDFYEKAVNNKLEKNDICFSFDDGLRCQFDIAYPILKKYNLTAFFFIPTISINGGIEKLEVYRHFRFSKFKDIDIFYNEFFDILKNSYISEKVDFQNKISKFVPDKYLAEYPFYTKNDKIFRYTRDYILEEENYDKVMSMLMGKYDYDIEENAHNLCIDKDCVRTLYKDNNIIGLHTHTHPTNMSKFDYNIQYEEYSTNKNILEDIIQNKVKTVSYPCNSYNEDTLNIMKKLNISLGFRANMAEGYDNILELPREDHANILGGM